MDASDMRAVGISTEGRWDRILFLRQQVSQVKKGGLSVLFRKCLATLKLAPAIAIILILRALRPLILVRFGTLSPQFGHFAANTYLYICERDAGLQPKRTFDIFGYGYRIPNQQLATMWERTLHLSSFFRGPLYLANLLVPGRTPHVVSLTTDRDFQGVIPRSREHLFFTAEEERLGEAGLRHLGLPEGAPFVCIYARDTAYKRIFYPEQGDDDLRNRYINSSIHNFMPAAEELARRGYFVLRMGAAVNEALRSTNPMIIDYATKARSEFMDIYLSAKCRFFFGCCSGLITVPKIFRRPMIHANFSPFREENLLTCQSGALVIPKKLWLRESGRFMTFREDPNVGSCSIPAWQTGIQNDESIAVDVIENTPEELLAVAVEMDERLGETWQTTEEDEELQQRFWSLFEIREPNEEFRQRLGAEFLRQNRELLD